MTCLREDDPNKPHFVIVPLPAQGHLIPMVDFGHILVERGVRVSLIITRANANRIKPTIERAKELHLSIQFIELSFPSAKFGLPEGWESVDNVTSFNLFRNFFDALYSLDEPLEAFLESLERPPDCMITDMCNPWTGRVARKFGIPRVIFQGPSCFYISAEHNLSRHKVFDHISDYDEYVVVPDFPVHVEVNKAQAPGFLDSPGFEDLRIKVLEERSTAEAVVINTFLELERPFVENYKKVIGKRVWTIGPICLYNNDVEMKASRGNKEALDRQHQVLSWLDSREAGSVLYVNFGSIAYTNPKQLIEIGTGLEASDRPFILVIKKIEMKPEVEKWLSEGFQERTQDRGLIIVGWAPQIVILSHRAVGGFMTHCGWNSMFESVSMGVPMITWPRFADQFLNEKLIVDVLKIGASLGVKVPNFATEDVVMVTSEEIRKAVSALMDGGIEAEERRERSKDYAEKAKKATAEGGSSYGNLHDFIHYFTERTSKLGDEQGHA